MLVCMVSLQPKHVIIIAMDSICGTVINTGPATDSDSSRKLTTSSCAGSSTLQTRAALSVCYVICSRL